MVWHPEAVDYAEYAANAPVGVQVLVSIAITAGVSMLLVGLLHPQLIRLAQEPKSDDEDGPRIPESYYLSGRIIQVTSIAFVFLFSFTVGQFVINARNADEATQLEAMYWSRAMMTAKTVPAAQGGDDIVTALSGYRTALLEEEWPLMARGDQWGAYEIQGQATTAITTATQEAARLGASDLPEWDALTGSVDELLMSGSDRIAYVPSQNAVSLAISVVILGVVSLAMTAIYQPARRRINVVLIGIMGAVYGFMFYMVVEISNPYQGGGAIQSLLAVMQ